jgi:hypothetical protein
VVDAKPRLHSIATPKNLTAKNFFKMDGDVKGSGLVLMINPEFKHV